MPDYPQTYTSISKISLLLLGIVFLVATTATAQTLVAPGATWKYNDQGINLGTSWRDLQYADSTWASGSAELGYGDSDEATVLSFGGNTNNRFPTYYFRHAFDVANPGNITTLTLRFLRDDGCVIYLNGTEVARSNLPTGTISYNTLASTAIGGADETAWQQVSVSTNLLRSGLNVIAVEIHQSATNSTDISFNLELRATQPQLPSPAVTLLTPAHGGASNTPAATFTALASDATGLQSATLYLGSNLQTAVFSGPQQVQDTQLSADQPTTNFGSATSINVDGLTPHAHGLIKFPNLVGNGPGQVPAGANISSATLRINCTNPGNVLKLFRLTQDWVEGEATWTRRTNSANWTSPGADGSGSNAGTSLDGPCTAAGLSNIDITRFLQEWTTNSPNFGILLADSGSDGIDFTSSESGNSPVLTVVYLGSREEIQTKLLSGAQATIPFDVTLPGAQTYYWNVLVTNSAGRQSWAQSDFQFTVDFGVPDVPSLIAPDDAANNVSTSPTLEVSVRDPDGQPLNVTFSGRTATAPEEFTIIALPDTQHYSEAYPEIYTSQTQWIVNNKAARNIVFVTHLGDIVQNATNLTEWQRANASMTLLDGVVPYGMGPGNHDQPTDLYNQFFPYSRYDNELWYGDHQGSKNDNNYQLISAGGVDFLIIHLEFCPPQSVITWADSVLKSYPNRKAIMSTHGYLGATAQRSVHGCTNTQYFWDGLAVPNPNLHFMLSGHVHAEARRTDVIHGHPVHQILSDYQDRPSGGEGWLRIMRFVPAENKIYVQTYSPWLDRYETDSDSQFTLDFSMAGFSTIGQRNSIQSGSPATLAWPNRLPGTSYEWKVAVSDITGKIQPGPVWRFDTGGLVPNQLPVADNLTVNGIEDNAIAIALTASDPEGAPLTYNIVNGPSQGTLNGSGPNLTYQPNANSNGSDSFTFKVNDGQADSNVATVAISVQAINDAPAATADAYSVQQDTQLSVTTPGVLSNDNDVDSGVLIAALLSPPANGTVDLSPNGSFVYTPNSGFAGTDSFSYQANDDLTNSNAVAVVLTVTPAGGAPILSANFDTGADGFTYLDNAFRNTNQSSYASGSRLSSGGFSGGALSVSLGGINNNTITGMSGGWQGSFTLNSPTAVVVSFRYNLTQTSEYENDEFSQVLVSIDGVLHGTVPLDFVSQINGNGNGGSSITTNWQTFTIHLGTLNSGTHTLRIGGFNSRKNSTSESTSVLIDDLTVMPGPTPVLEANFNSTSDGFIYLDDLFRGTGQPAYASGTRVSSGGYSGGALRVTLGGINSSTIVGMSGGWRKQFTLNTPTQLILAFRYNLTQSAEYESDEVSQMLLDVDGVLYGQAPTDYLAQVVGNGSGGSAVTTGWRSFEVVLTLASGTHTVTLGAYNNKKNASNESTTALIDDLLLLPVP